MPKQDNTEQLEFSFLGEAPTSSKVLPSPTPAARELRPRSSKPVSPVISNPENNELADRALLLAKANELVAFLRAQTGLRIRLTITDNTHSIISSRMTPDGIFKLNLHHMFLETKNDIREALARWLKNPRDKTAGETVNRHISASRNKIAKRPKRKIILYTQGHVHDLLAIYNEVNRECFSGAINSPIGWGKMPAKMPRRSIRFGSYDNAVNVIRIHPLLDQKFVPRYYVKFVVFHEMLHADMGIGESESGRRSIHPPEFRKRERAYPEYELAMAWEKDMGNMGRIFNARKRSA